jgi:hypothetical protein
MEKNLFFEEDPVEAKKNTTRNGMNGIRREGKKENEQKPEAPKFISCHSGVRCFQNWAIQDSFLICILQESREKKRICFTRDLCSLCMAFA